LVYLEHHAADQNFWDSHWNLDLARSRKILGTRRTLVTDVTRRYLRPADGPILEGGCGIGVHVAALQNHGYQAIGVDYAAKTMAMVRQYLPRSDVRLGDVRSLVEFPDRHFAGYWSLGVIEHFWSGYEDIAREMLRVLRPGGYLFLTFPHMSPLRRVKARWAAQRAGARARDAAWLTDRVISDSSAAIRHAACPHCPPSVPGAASMGCKLPAAPAATDFVATGKAHLHLIIMAFACDITRVDSIQWRSSDTSFTWVGVNGGHHNISHQRGNAGADASLVKIMTWSAEQVAYILSSLKSFEAPGGGTLLDGTPLYWVNELAVGNHRFIRTPYMLAAGKMPLDSRQDAGDRLLSEVPGPHAAHRVCSPASGRSWGCRSTTSARPSGSAGRCRGALEAIDRCPRLAGGSAGRWCRWNLARRRTPAAVAHRQQRRRMPPAPTTMCRSRRATIRSGTGPSRAPRHPAPATWGDRPRRPRLRSR
jgi:SAM-dependent methyltransferase